MKRTVKVEKDNTIIHTAILAKTQTNRISNRLGSELDVLRKEMNSISDGKLYIRYRGELVIFNERRNGKMHGITRNRDLVYALARRQYLKLSVELFEQILEEGWTTEVERIIERLYPPIEALLKKYEEAGLDIDMIIMTPNQRIWNSDRHSQKNTRREELIYPTKGGIYMRSKSERMIGDLLELLHIPYRYETELVINNRAYHPDFIIMLPDDRLVILEHVGRMDLREYDADLITRLQAFDRIGLLIARDVFFSFEHDTKEDLLVKEVLFQILTSNPSRNKIIDSLARSAGCQL